MNREEFELRSADLHVRARVDGDIGFIAGDVVDSEFVAKKLLREYPRTVDFSCNLFLIIASAVKPRWRVQSSEIPMTAHMIPVGVRDEEGGERGQPGRRGSQRFVGRLREIRTRS